jgi:hypothetical protein
VSREVAEELLFPLPKEQLIEPRLLSPVLGRSLRVVLLELLDISILDLLHQVATAKEIRPNMGTQLTGYDIKLVVGGLEE